MISLRGLCVCPPPNATHRRSFFADGGGATGRWIGAQRSSVAWFGRKQLGRAAAARFGHSLHSSRGPVPHRRRQAARTHVGAAQTGGHCGATRRRLSTHVVVGGQWPKEDRGRGAVGRWLGCRTAGGEAAVVFWCCGAVGRYDREDCGRLWGRTVRTVLCATECTLLRVRGKRDARARALNFKLVNVN
jgi:hypothetical protein